jgi:4-amino-4-deoxy-L-arabinose transferase-like glycosyltransferase
MCLQKFIKKFKKLKTVFWLSLIVIFAIFLRLIFFVGFSSNPAQENLHLSIVRSIYEGNFEKYLSRYRNIPKDYVGDPAETHAMRWMLNYPTAFFWIILGINDIATSMWTAIASIGIIISTFYIGKILYDEKSGLLAAFLVSFFPTDVINATRFDTDIIVAFFMALSVLFFLRSLKYKNNKRINYLLTGLFVGLGYLTKPFSILLPFIFLIYLIYERKLDRKILFFFTGFLIIIILEGLYYSLTTGHFFLNYIITSTAFRKYLYVTLSGSFYLLNNFKVLHFYRPPLYYFPYLLNINEVASDVVPQKVWLFFYFFIISTIILLWKRQYKMIVFPLIWLLFLLFFMEFGPFSIEFDKNTSTINYLLMFKETRYISILSIPISLILAYFLVYISRNIYSKIIAGTIVFLLFMFSVNAISSSSSLLVNGISDMRETFSFLKNQSFKNIYCDSDCSWILNYYFGFKKENSLKNIENIKTPEEIESQSYVIVGGSRNLVVGGEWLDNKYPDFVKNPPENWKLVKIIEKERTSWRESNMSIYNVF